MLCLFHHCFPASSQGLALSRNIVNEILIVPIFHFRRVTQITPIQFLQQPFEVGIVIVLSLQIQKMELRKILDHVTNKSPCQALNLHLPDPHSCPDPLNILLLRLCFQNCKTISAIHILLCLNLLALIINMQTSSQYIFIIYLYINPVFYVDLNSHS